MSLEEESQNRQKLESELNTQITSLEKNCQKMLEETAKVTKPKKIPKMKTERPPKPHPHLPNPPNHS